MKINVQVPCHQRTVAVPASVDLAKPTTVGDRRCTCGCWWRFDTRLLSLEGGRITHVCEWTRVGHLAGR